ncbi:MAG: hypothetical protein WDZ35_15100 [Crocinitomicaceae bacterium]
MYNIEFKRGKEGIKITDGEVSEITFSMDIKKLSKSFLVNIPSYDIHFSTTSKDNIEKLALKSFNSFFEFWLIKKGVKDFMQHMMNLGFKT